MKERLKFKFKSLMALPNFEFSKEEVSRLEELIFACLERESEADFINLENVDLDYYGFSDFFDLPEEPEIDRVIPIKGKMIPILRLHRIIGTVLDRDKAKKTVNILTPEGTVVPVKIFGDAFTHYDKQISEKDIA